MKINRKAIMKRAEEKGISQSAVARAAGMSTSRFFTLASGRGSASEDEVARIAKALNVEVDEIGVQEAAHETAPASDERPASSKPTLVQLTNELAKLINEYGYTSAVVFSDGSTKFFP